MMDMNAAYVSRVFKNETGEVLLDYINNVRVEEAKRILKEEKRISMEELADSCGFSNVRTFRRIFTKYTGASPTKYYKS